MQKIATLLETPPWIKSVEVLVAIAAIIHACQYVRKGIVWYKGRRHGKKAPSALVVPCLSPTLRDYIFGIVYAVLCAVLWSVSYVSLSYVTARVNPVEVNAIVLGSATIFLFLGFWIARFMQADSDPAPIPISWRTWKPWLIALANLLSFILFVYALRFVSASQTITLSKINPLFIALFSWVLFKQRPPASTISAAFLVVLGTVLITANERFTFDVTTEVIGSFLAILAGLGFALFSVGLEQIERRHSSRSERLLFLAVVFFLSYVGIVTVAHFERLGTDPIDSESIVILLLNGLRAAIVYILFQAAVRRIGALRVSVLVALEVPFTMFWDSAWLGRIPANRLIWGSATILFAALTLGWDMLRAKNPVQNAAQSAVDRT